mmetsp:Transcript_25620/g.55370  ORF Transcript_25620/g.55370 Transcript_25620/m.55370 type:complete len:209 (+) Transcript_25620:212-838(+)
MRRGGRASFESTGSRVSDVVGTRGACVCWREGEHERPDSSRSPECHRHAALGVRAGGLAVLSAGCGRRDRRSADGSAAGVFRHAPATVAAGGPGRRLTAEGRRQPAARLAGLRLCLPCVPLCTGSSDAGSSLGLVGRSCRHRGDCHYRLSLSARRSLRQLLCYAGGGGAPIAPPRLVHVHDARGARLPVSRGRAGTKEAEKVGLQGVP